MHRPTIAAFLLGLTAFLAGCNSGGSAGSHDMPETAALTHDHGFALLYATIKDEADVDKVLAIKSPSAPVKDVIKAIGEFSRNTKSAIENLAKETPPLALKDQGLPDAETKARAAISSATSKQIIFHGGKELEFRLLLTQHEALNYITYLAQTLAEAEPTGNRKQFLTNVAKQATTLHDQVLALLKAPYTGSPKD